MAEEKAKSKGRTLKKTVSVRERAERAVEGSQQPRRLQSTRHRASAPFRLIGKGFSVLGRFKLLRIIGYIIVPPYIRNSWKELRQVTWPKPKESIRLTSAVFAFAAIFGVLVALLDFGLDKVFKEVLLR